MPNCCRCCGRRPKRWQRTSVACCGYRRCCRSGRMTHPIRRPALQDAFNALRDAYAKHGAEARAKIATAFAAKHFDGRKASAASFETGMGIAGSWPRRPLSELRRRAPGQAHPGAPARIRQDRLRGSRADLAAVRCAGRLVRRRPAAHAMARRTGADPAVPDPRRCAPAPGLAEADAPPADLRRPDRRCRQCTGWRAGRRPRAQPAQPVRHRPGR